MSKLQSYIKKGDNLYQNPASGTYFATVRRNGRLVKSSLKTTDKAEAKRKLAAFIADLDKIDGSAARVTVGGLVDRYLGTLGTQAPSTTAKKIAMANAIKLRLGSKKARALTPSEVLKWRRNLTVHNSTDQLGVNSRNKFLRVLRAIYQLAVDDRLLAYSPVAGIKEERLPKPIRETPNLDEFKAIVTSIRTQPGSDTREESADYVEFLGLAGLGLAEASSLTWGDVHLDRDEIITFRHKTATGFRIPVYPQVRGLLEKRLKIAKRVNGGDAPASTTKVFEVKDPKKAIEAACVRLGFVRRKDDREVARYSSRSMRRLFITTALERGVDVAVVAGWQGHRDGGRLILTTYNHTRQEHGDRLAKLMTSEVPKNVISIAAATA
jgi:integrase